MYAGYYYTTVERDAFIREIVLTRRLFQRLFQKRYNFESE